MTRDLDLIRKIMMEIDQMEDRRNAFYVHFPDYPIEKVQFNLRLMEDAGLVICFDLSGGYHNDL